jgi:enediyne polyketide synthase
MSTRIAIVGIACRYPDTASPKEMWENVLAGRRAFRRLPDERMRQADYYSPDPKAPDRFYSPKAAVIEGYEFDRVGFKIAGSTYRSTDMTHWLALDVAAQALADAGYPEGNGLPKRNTGVVIGNSLTGEFSRASMMRLRWPYVQRVVASALREQGWSDDQLAPFMASLEQQYKSPFAPIDEDTLAGGLSNTIAGRVCNHFDFKGGGYTVDGACSSSLLSVATACRALVNGEIDVAVAGGVDLSIDPFEVIGFAKTGALATGEMRVYDRNSNGFWPGEGCGMVVLMREDDAVAADRPAYALIAGWGVSSDGKGGITRPEASGHQLAIERAYERAGFGMDTVSYFEGHGTGTAVGDATELKALSMARRLANPDAPTAAIGTVKGNFGHTKAAAGIAGVIKATLTVQHQVIPPGTGHVDTHPELQGDRPALRVPSTVEEWPAGKPVRVGISSMGFGGINTHLVLEAPSEPRRRKPASRPAKELVASRQDAELLLVDAVSLSDLRDRLAQLAGITAKLAYAELGDLAATLQRDLSDKPIRAAVVCASPEEADRRLSRLVDLIDGGARSVIDVNDGVFLGRTGLAPRIGYLFPGQGSGRGSDGGALRKRFGSVDELYRRVNLPTTGDQVATAVAQPRIVTASVAGLKVLAELGIQADVGVGHSLGELTALYWAGAMNEDVLLRTAAARGRVMAQASRDGGTMASIAAPPVDVEPLLIDEPVVIAGYNSPHQTVVSGPVDAVERVGKAAERKGLSWTRIAVSHAFHSPLVQPAAEGLAEFLAGEEFSPITGSVMSTVTGSELPADTDVRALLRAQVLDPVRFAEAAARAGHGADLMIEVGPGRVLAGLVAEVAPAVPVVAIDSGGPSIGGLLRAIGAAYALGAQVHHQALFEGRFTRPFDINREMHFFASPCEAAPDVDVAAVAANAGIALATAPAQPAAKGTSGGSPTGEDTLELLMRLAAERAELPRSAVAPDSLPLDELHLSSITVGQVMNEAARVLGLNPPSVTSSYATATIRELARTLDELADTELPGESSAAEQSLAGVAGWVRSFDIDWREAPRPAAVTAAAGTPQAHWRVFASGPHPLAEPLRGALAGAGLGDGVLLCLPPNCGADDIKTMLSAAHAVLDTTGPARFVVVQHGRGASGLAKTLHLETPRIATTVVDAVPAGDAEGTARLIAAVVAETAATTGFVEVTYDEAGVRRVPILRPMPQPVNPPTEIPLGPADVLLVTGGGKGITAECALAIGRDTGVGVGLLGRSDPAGDPELSANLERMTAAGLRVKYLRADVTSATEVAAAVAELQQAFGPVTAVLHGAGRNEPQALSNLKEAAFLKTLAPKIDGLRYVLDAVDKSGLKLLVTFGSIIGRAGLRGEGDYATANDWMTHMTLEVARDYPNCRCLAMEWSVWSGAGMGERLGVVESLVRDGITPIPADRGIEVMLQTLADPNAPTVMVISGRAQGLSTITIDSREVPLLRFVDQPRVFYPGIELVADAELSSPTDPYLDDHLLDGSMLFPAVIGMEAMSHAALAVSGRTEVPVLENVEFLRPVVVAPGGTTPIRLAALVIDDDTVDVVIRSSETGFQADHFRARLHYPKPELSAAAPERVELPPVPLDSMRDLYGGILFQGKRFHRLVRYRRLAAKYCEAEISLSQTAPWFGSFLPQETLLGDPGARDAFMHSIQACIPHATLLPVGIEKLYPSTRTSKTDDFVVMYAAERSRTGDTFVYDVDIRTESGELVEQWVGMKLQAVRKQDGRGPWAPALLGPYLERQLVEVLDVDPIAVVVEPDEGEELPSHRSTRRERTAIAVSRALGRVEVVRYRPDGKPEVSDGTSVSSSHGADTTFAVAGHGPLGCDVQEVLRKPEPDWAGLLGASMELATMVANDGKEDLAIAATRVWSAIECLRKSGRSITDQLSFHRRTRDGWVIFSIGDLRVATFTTLLADVSSDVIFAVLAKERG